MMGQRVVDVVQNSFIHFSIHTGANMYSTENYSKIFIQLERDV